MASIEEEVRKQQEEAEKFNEYMAGKSKGPDSAPLGRALGVEPGAVPTDAGMSAIPSDFMTSLQRPGYMHDGYPSHPVADLLKIIAQAGAGAAGGGRAGAALSLVGPLFNPDALHPAAGAGNITEAMLGGVGKGLTKMLPKQMEPGALMEKLFNALRGFAENYANTSDYGGSDDEKALSAGGGSLLNLLVPAGIRKAQRSFRQLPSSAAKGINEDLMTALKPPANLDPLQQAASQKINRLAGFPGIQKPLEQAGLDEQANSLQKLLMDRKVKVLKPSVKGAMTNTRVAQANVDTLPGSLRPGDRAVSPQAKLLADKQLAEGAVSGKLNSYQNASTAAEQQALKFQANSKVAEEQLNKLTADAGMNPGQFSPRSRVFLNSLKGDKTTLHNATQLALKDQSHAEGFLDILKQMDPDAASAARENVVRGIFQSSKTGKGGTILPRPYKGTDIMDQLDTYKGESALAFDRFFGSSSALADLKAIAQKAVDADEFAKKANFMSPRNLVHTGAAVGALQLMGRPITDPTGLATVMLFTGGAHYALNIPHLMEASLQEGNWKGKALLKFLDAKDPSKLSPKVTNEAMKFLTAVSLPPTPATETPKK